MAMRWKKNPRPTGLRAIGAPPRGSTLRDGEHELARTYAYGFRDSRKGWYWTAGNDEAGVPLMNTCNEPVADEAAAKVAALAYVRDHLAKLRTPAPNGAAANHASVQREKGWGGVMSKSTDRAMVEEAMKALAIIPKLKQEERGPYLSALLMISYKLLRTVEGDEFVRGWLEGALHEVKTQAPDVAINELH